MNNSKIQLIVECSISLEEKNLLKDLGEIKYKLPSINSYVLEIEEKNLNKVKNIKEVESVYQNTHIKAQMNEVRKIVNAEKMQEKGYTGKGVTVAILDTGICPKKDFVLPYNRILKFKDFVNGNNDAYDDNGHGTHVSGICGGNGHYSGGKYKGIAPNCNFVVLKVLDKDGQGNSGDVLGGIQWIIDNKNKYNIRVLNLSIGTDSESLNDPLVKAVEKLWEEGIVVIIAAGNNGPNKGTITSPAISKKIITIGSSDDDKKTLIGGNSLKNFSGRGPTLECIIKPDVLAPGVNIVSCLANNEKETEKNYLALSGTSMSTPIVSGAVALLLEKYPKLSPNEVKLMLKKSCKDLNLPKNQQGWGLLDVEKLMSMEVNYERK